MDFFCFFFHAGGTRGTHASKILQSPNVKPKGAPFKRGMAPKNDSFSASVSFLTSLVVLRVAALCHSGVFTAVTLVDKSHPYFVVRASQTFHASRGKNSNMLCPGYGIQSHFCSPRITQGMKVK